MSEFFVELAPAAEDEIGDAYLWYHERNPLAANAFRSEVFDAIDRIAMAPMTWPADDEGDRKYSLRRFPYSVLYEVQGSTVTILAVAHHRRKPNYWRERQS
ncbi:MAG: type II toxin-antitoxin system RelE/ParE family toxin [Acidobacteriota bacterium]